MSNHDAELMGVRGRGYAVVESLASLGKGRRLTGLFLVEDSRAHDFARARDSRDRVEFHGVVHHRHRSATARLLVEVTGVHPEDDQRARIEFSSWDVPYDVAG